MATMNIDEVNVSALVRTPATITVDEVNVSAIVKVEDTLPIDNIYARGVSKLPPSVVVDRIHVGAVKAITPINRFKEGYKKEVLDGAAGAQGITLPIDNYDVELKGVVPSNPLLATLRITARKVSGYRRYSDVVYKRSDASMLGNHITPDLLRPTEAWPLNTTAQIIARINALFGTTLTDIDFVEEPTQAGVDRVLTAAASSFYFQPGSKISLGRLDNNERSTEVVGLAWTEVETRMMSVFTCDFSPNKVALLATAGSILGSADSAAIVAMITTALGSAYNIANQAYTDPQYYGIRNAPFKLYTLPTALDLPVDNSGFYNRALVIDLLQGPNFKSRYMVLHFNA